MSDQPPKTFSSMTPKMSFVLFQPNERKSQNRFSKGWVISLTMMFWQGFLIFQYNSNHYSFIGVVKKGFWDAAKLYFLLTAIIQTVIEQNVSRLGREAPLGIFPWKKQCVSGVVKKTSRDSLWCAIVEQKQEDNWEYLHLLLDKAAVVSNNPRKCIKQKNIKEKHSSLGVDFS